MQEKNEEFTFFLQFIKKTKLPQIKPIQVEDFVDHLFCLGAIDNLQQFLPWLEQDKIKELVIFEDDLSRIKSFMETNMHAHPQVNLHYVQSMEDIERVIFTMKLGYPKVILGKTSAKKLQDKVLEVAFLMNAYVSDILQPELYFQNFYSNVKHLKQSHLALDLSCLKNKPAFIFGSGPSLNAYLPHLAQLQNKGFIFAAGSSATILSKNQLMPHLCFIVDPNEQQFMNLQQMQCQQSPCVFTLRAKKEALDFFQAEKYYIPFASEDRRENYVDILLNLEQSAFCQLDNAYSTAGLFALQFAIKMQMQPIYLLGFDLCRTQQTLYANGLPNVEEKGKQIGEEVVYINGKRSCVKWQVEKKAFEDVSKLGSQLFSIGDGVEFASIPSISWQTILQLPNFNPRHLMQEGLKNCRKIAVAKVQQLETQLLSELTSMQALIDKDISHSIERELTMLQLQQFSCFEPFFAQLDHFFILQCKDAEQTDLLTKRMLNLRRAIQLHLAFAKAAQFGGEDKTNPLDFVGEVK